MLNSTCRLPDLFSIYTRAPNTSIDVIESRSKASIFRICMLQTSLIIRSCDKIHKFHGLCIVKLIINVCNTKNIDICIVKHEIHYFKPDLLLRKVWNPIILKLANSEHWSLHTRPEIFNIRTNFYFHALYEHVLQRNIWILVENFGITLKLRHALIRLNHNSYFMQKKFNWLWIKHITLLFGTNIIKSP